MKKTFLLLLLGLIACEKDASNIPIPFEKKLVIESYLSPQDTELRVTITQNYPTVGPGSVRGAGFQVPLPPPPAATITLSDGQQTVPVPLRVVRDAAGNPIPERSGYLLPASALPIVPGRTYTLRVTAPGFPEAEATCTIPLRRVEASTAEIIRGTETSPGGGGARTFYQAVFTDLSGEENYYSTALSVLNTVTPPPAQGRPYTNINTQGTQFHSQGTTDGGKIKTGRAFSFGDGQLPANWLQTRQLELIIATTDQPYFDYNRTLRQQQRSDENPFAEPVLVYSNVRGGLGIFAGYQLSRVLHTL